VRSRSAPILVNFGHFLATQIFDSGYLTHFLSEGDKNWHNYGSGSATNRSNMAQSLSDYAHLPQLVMRSTSQRF